MEELHLGQGLERGGAFDLGGAVRLVEDRDRLPLDLEGLFVAPLKGAGSRQHGERDPALAGVGGAGRGGRRAEAPQGVLSGRNVPGVHGHAGEPEEGREQLRRLAAETVLDGCDLELVHGQGFGEPTFVLVEPREVTEGLLEAWIRRRQLLRDGQGGAELGLGSIRVAHRIGVLAGPRVALPGRLGGDRQGEHEKENRQSKKSHGVGSRSDRKGDEDLRRVVHRQTHGAVEKVGFDETVAGDREIGEIKEHGADGDRPAHDAPWWSPPARPRP